MTETTFEARGRVWRLRLGFGALCRIERKFDQPFARVMQTALPHLFEQDEATRREASLDLRIADLRDILAAALGGGVTEAEVEEIVDEIGLDRAVVLLTEAAMSDLGGSEKSTEDPPESRSE